MIKTKTKSGVDVTLTGIDSYGRATVRVEFTHPKVGKVSFESDAFGSPPNDKTTKGIIGYVGGQRACVTVPKADFDAAMAEARAIGAREIASLRSGETKIKLAYHDGEYLSGYSAYGRAAALLVELGVAKEVSGWGTHVDGRMVQALGQEFTYAQAAEYARPALEAKQAAKGRKDAERAEKFAEAKRTGKPVVLRSWMDECDDPEEECTWDSVTEYALPDGTTKIERHHTW